MIQDIINNISSTMHMQDHLPEPLFDVSGGPGGGSFGRSRFLSTGFSVGISPLGNTSLAPAK